VAFRCSQETKGVVNLERLVANASAPSTYPNADYLTRRAGLVHGRGPFLDSLDVDLAKLEYRRFVPRMVGEEKTFAFIIRVLAEGPDEGNRVLRRPRFVAYDLG
jgi:hypothetical protein